MGRTTYDPVTQELSPDVYFYEDKHSYIITSHPEPSTASRTFTKEDPVTLIRRLKEEDGASSCWRPKSGFGAFGYSIIYLHFDDNTTVSG